MKALGKFREIYKKDSKAAEEFLKHGELGVDPKADKAELAAWTMLANQLLNLDEVTSRE